jgi:hypothetical protein
MLLKFDSIINGPQNGFYFKKWCERKHIKKDLIIRQKTEDEKYVQKFFLLMILWFLYNLLCNRHEKYVIFLFTSMRTKN